LFEIAFHKSSKTIITPSELLKWLEIRKPSKSQAASNAKTSIQTQPRNFVGWLLWIFSIRIYKHVIEHIVTVDLY